MSPLVPAVAGSNASLRPIGFALLSYACFATADAMVKLSSARFSVFQIGFTLALAALVPVLLLTRGQGGLKALVPQRWRLVALRGLLTATCALLAWAAFGMLPLADGYAILFAAPILVTALSVPLLGESVGWRRWLAGAVGFAGVVVMIRPDFATLGLGHLLGVLAAVAGALGFSSSCAASARTRRAPRSWPRCSSRSPSPAPRWRWATGSPRRRASC